MLIVIIIKTGCSVVASIDKGTEGNSLSSAIPTNEHLLAHVSFC